MQIQSVEHALVRTRALAASTPVGERLLLDIIDTIREPLLVLDARHRVSQANLAFFRTFRVVPDETLGRELFALGDGQWDIAPLRELLRDRLAVEAKLEDFEVDHVFPGIGRKIMLLNARAVTQVATAPPLVLLAFEDVTERRFTEWRLAERQRELERSNIALDDYASIASHDLQEPLRKILSFGERLSIALGPRLTGDARHSLDRMLSAATRMRQLVQDVLEYSQVTSRVHPFSSTDVAWVIREIVTDMAADLQAAGAEVTIGPLPRLDANPPQMRQLFQNLLSNALKFRKKDVALVVQISSVARSGGQCAISVADNGIGFNQDYAEKIFQMFVRLHGRTQYEGSGIGLSICAQIVQRHGGTIVASGTPGKGATFTVTLPVTHVQGALT